MSYHQLEHLPLQEQVLQVRCLNRYVYPPEDEGLVASSHSHSRLVVLDLILLQHNIARLAYLIYGML